MYRVRKDWWGVSVLIVTDEFGCAKSLDSIIRPVFTPKIVSSRSEGIRAIDQLHRLYAIIVDVQLPDGDGYELAEVARCKASELPIILLTDYSRSGDINRAFRISAHLLTKPIDCEDTDSIRRFLVGIPPTRISGCLHKLSLEKNLTRRESEILSLTVSGHSNRTIAELLSISPNTLKSYTKGLLVKCNAQNLRQLAFAVIRSEMPGIDQDENLWSSQYSEIAE